MQQISVSIRLLLAAFFLGHIAHAAAQPSVPGGAPPTETQAQRESEARAALKAAIETGTRGPARITLNDQGQLQVPAHTVWVPQAQANRLLSAWGNGRSPDTIGMVLGKSGEELWPAIVSYRASGFIKDGEAAKLDPSAILDNLREGTDQDNESRVARGFPALDLGNWLQRPRYDAVSKRLIWAFPLTERGMPGAQPTVNYNTRALGRYGYFSLNLLTDPVHFDSDKRVADGLLGGLTFNPGKSYADFNAGTDHVAEYGLAALIGVVALKKLGLIAIAGAFILKFAKLGALAVFGAGAALRRFLGRKKAAPVPAKPAEGPRTS